MEKNKRFKIVCSQRDGVGVKTEILVDRETGVNYMFHQNGYSGGLTPLLDKDGNVVVTPVSDQ